MNTNGCAQIAAEVISQAVGIAAAIGECVSKLLADKEPNK